MNETSLKNLIVLAAGAVLANRIIVNVLEKSEHIVPADRIEEITKRGVNTLRKNIEVCANVTND